MKVSAEKLTEHVLTVGVGGRIPEVVFGANFHVEAVDGGDEVAVQADSDITFPDKFGVMDVAGFAKLVSTFKGEEVDLILKDGKLVIKGHGRRVLYQTADVSTIMTTMKTKNFSKLEKAYFEKVDVSIDVDPSFMARYSKLEKKIKPGLVSFVVGEKTASVVLPGIERHDAEVEVGSVLSDKRKKAKDPWQFKISAAAFGDVVKRFPKPVRTVGEEDEVNGSEIKMDIGAALRITIGDLYTFIISRQQL